jgi:hypothetical protein
LLQAKFDVTIAGGEAVVLVVVADVVPGVVVAASAEITDRPGTEATRTVAAASPFLKLTCMGPSFGEVRGSLGVGYSRRRSRYGRSILRDCARGAGDQDF